VTAPLTDADLAAMEARADARVRWCEWAPTRLAPPSEFCGAACTVRCDGCAVTRCAAHAEECDGGCDHAWTTLDESAADLRAALAEVRRLRGMLRAYATACDVIDSPQPPDGAASWDAALSAHDAARDALYAEGKR
jgi:hypothetical protein